VNSATAEITTTGGDVGETATGGVEEEAVMGGRRWAATAALGRPRQAAVDEPRRRLGLAATGGGAEAAVDGDLPRRAAEQRNPTGGRAERWRERKKWIGGRD